MLCRYQILSYIPCFGLSKEQLQHCWIWFHLAHHLKHKMFVPSCLIQKMSQQIFHLEKQRSVSYSDDEFSLFLEYHYDSGNCLFKIQWYLIIYG